MRHRKRWTPAQAWKWYNHRPWMRGCNYLASDCCNRIAMWQSLDFEKHLETIEKYSLFQQLIDSNGIIDESVLDKLKLNVRSLIASMEENSKDLLDLCIDVIYHNNMKAFGLHQLILLYIKWEKEKEEKETAEGEESNG